VFLGNYEHNIDSKGRLSVPAKFRAELGDTMYVTRWLDKCLALYPAPQFEKLRSQVSSLSIADPNARNLRRIFYAEAAEVELDRQGRINIPVRLREFAGITGDDARVIVVGMDNYVEIWTPERWDALQDEVEENAGSIAAQLGTLGVI
jgi:MraZ protein